MGNIHHGKHLDEGSVGDILLDSDTQHRLVGVVADRVVVDNPVAGVHSSSAGNPLVEGAVERIVGLNLSSQPEYRLQQQLQ